MFFPSFLMLYCGVQVFLPTPFEKRKKLILLCKNVKNFQRLTRNNSYDQKQPTLMSHPSHLLTSLSHIAMLPLVSTVISSSFSPFAWEVVPNHSIDLRRDDSTCAEQHGKHGPFLHETTQWQHGGRSSFLRVTCHLQQYSAWWNRYMEDQQDSNEVHVKWRCLWKWWTVSIQKCGFISTETHFQLKTYCMLFQSWRAMFHPIFGWLEAFALS